MHQKSLLGLTCHQVASKLNVDRSTVQRTVQLFEDTGTVCSIQGYHQNTIKKLSVREEIAIIDAVVDNPAMYLSDLQQHVLYTTGTSISTSTICQLLKKQGFSHKKTSFHSSAV